MKNFLFLLLPVLLFSCSGLKNGGNNKGVQQVPITHSLVKSIYTGNNNNLKGVQDLRFHFQQELVLTLVDLPGNGVYSVTPQGDVTLLSEATVRFPTNKLGKFVIGDDGMLMLDRVFSIIFEKDNDASDPRFGTSKLEMYYDEKGAMRIWVDADYTEQVHLELEKIEKSAPKDSASDGKKSTSKSSAPKDSASGGKKPASGSVKPEPRPVIKYRNAFYFLPDNYLTNDMIASQKGKGRERIVKGVKTPAQGG